MNRPKLTKKVVRGLHHAAIVLESAIHGADEWDDERVSEVEAATHYIQRLAEWADGGREEEPDPADFACEDPCGECGPCLDAQEFHTGTREGKQR